MINILCTEKNGKVVDILSVKEIDDIILISKNGILIRLAAKEISIIGRNTQGMRVMKLVSPDNVVAAEKVVGI